MKPTPPCRCAWARGDLDVIYHDTEWGVPLHDDRMLFELLILEGAQAGLSWSTILKKRATYRAAFDDFDAEPDGQRLAILFPAVGHEPTTINSGNLGRNLLTKISANDRACSGKHGRCWPLPPLD